MHHSKYSISIDYDTIKNGPNIKFHLLFSKSDAAKTHHILNALIEMYLITEKFGLTSKRNKKLYIQAICSCSCDKIT